MQALLLQRSEASNLLAKLKAPLSGSDKERNKRLAIYQNNVMHSLIRALADTYPVIERLIGTDRFRLLATEYVNATPPVQANLNAYGKDFTAFISAHEALQALPFLKDVARLEWLYLQCFNGQASETLDVQVLQQLPEESLEHLLLTLDTNAYLMESDWPIQSIWHANLEDEVPELNLDELPPSRLIICRIQNQVQVIELTPDCYYFLEALASKQTLAEAWQSAGEQLTSQKLEIPDLDELGPMLAYLINLQIFTQAVIKD